MNCCRNQVISAKVQSTLLLDFVEATETELNTKAIKEFLPMQPGDVVTTYADIEDIKNELGYMPKPQLRTELKILLNGIKNII